MSKEIGNKYEEWEKDVKDVISKVGEEHELASADIPKIMDELNKRGEKLQKELEENDDADEALRERLKNLSGRLENVAKELKKKN